MALRGDLQRRFRFPLRRDRGRHYLGRGHNPGSIASFAVGRPFGRSAVAMIIGEEKLANWGTDKLTFRLVLFSVKT